jgi:4-amino-4-deoxy-L-arabinose transferase-like glycosyltransferase
MDMPSASAEPEPPAATPRARGLGVVALALLLVSGALHLGYLLWNCPLDLSGDEAHYWEWSRHLDLSYYSKGPLVAYLIALGRLVFGPWSQQVFGNDTLAVRVPAILLSIGTGLGMYVLGAKVLKQPRVGLAAVALTLTVPVLAVGAILLTIDAPLACCYVWTLIACAHGLRTGRFWPWLVAGLLIAIGILAKYTMVLVFPVVGLALLTEAPYRTNLRRPGPYVALLLGLAGLIPILVWNAQHGWVSFHHVAGQAGVENRSGFNPAGVLEFFLGQAAVIGPIWFALLLWAVIALWRRPQAQVGEAHDPAELKLLLYATVVPWAVFLAFSFITKVQPNWPVLAVLPGLPLLVLWLARRMRANEPGQQRTTRRLTVAGIVLGAASVLLMHRTELLYPLFNRVLPPPSAFNLTPAARLDPTARLRGWSQLGAAVGKHLAAERAAGREPFIITDDYQVSSQVAFYCPGQPVTYCLQAVLGARQSQYDIWPNPIRDPDRFVGRPCLYIGARKPELFGDGNTGHVALRGARLLETVEHRVCRQPVQIWSIYAVDEYAGLAPEVLQRSGQKF